MPATLAHATTTPLGAVETAAIAAAKAVAPPHNEKGMRLMVGSNATDLLTSYDNFLLDCDGVLWQAGHLLPRARETVALLQRLGKRVLFVTNNSTRSREAYRQKMAKMGIVARKEDIVPASYAAAEYIATEHRGVKKAFVVGAAGIADELRERGIAVLGADAPTEASLTEEEFMRMSVDPDIGAVVCGWDMSFNFRKLCTASLILQKNPDALFLATNRDDADRLADRSIPGNGCAVAALETATSRKAVCTGKPSKWLSSMLVDRFGLDRERTLMVGDRLSTDILFGNRAGMATAMVMTGGDTPADVDKLSSDDVGVPDFVLPYLGALYDAAQGGNVGARAGAGAGAEAPAIRSRL